ncbi:hypothetical protein SUGI_0020770 [Cryptomeria japonica]|nr:hypothetical protein SUGI_0020770 [Cryptomeria japonica]
MEGMLGHFRTTNGQFLSSIAQTEEEKIRGILDLFRASHIAFNREKILDEAKEFSTAYLNQAMEKSVINSNLLQEMVDNDKLLSLAKMDFDAIESLHQEELKAYSRFGIANFSTIATYLDDIYNTYGKCDELKLLTEAIKKWDPTSIDHLPEYMKIVYMASYDTINEMDREVELIQGRSTFIPSKDAV